MNRRAFLKTLSALSFGAVSLPRLIDAQQAASLPFDIYMTFDDGPFSSKDFKTGPTDIVLQTLKDKSVTATFFLHGFHILDWDGPTLVRYLADGHSIGNHTWRQGGNTTLDNTPWALLTEQYLQAEVRIRDLLQATDASAYQHYMNQPKLFRRPGGNDGLNDFLKPKNWLDLRYEPYLRPYWDRIDWLNGVYDYSGWHINGGESVPLSLRPNTAPDELQFILYGKRNYYGVDKYLHPRSLEADQGLVILMHDAEKNTDAMLPDLIDTLRGWGASFRSLPRPFDRPNTRTVGVGRMPTPQPKTIEWF